MLDIRWIRDNPEALDRALANRGAEPQSASLIALDEARRAAIGKLEEAQNRRNIASKEIGKAKAQKDEALAAKLMAEVASLKDEMATLEAAQRDADKAFSDAMAMVPNVPLADVPVGPDEHANVEYRRSGTKPGLNDAKQHFELGEALGMMDFEAAAKLSGARFVVLKQGLARLERALGQFMLDLHTEEHGYTEVQPPLLVRDEAMFGTAQLPKFRWDQFMASWEIDWSEISSILSARLDHPSLMTKSLRPDWVQDLAGRIAHISAEAETAYEREQHGSLVLKHFIEGTGLRGLGDTKWLIPTAEVPLTNLVRESVLSEDELPIRVTALTPCFRSEAGSAGKDTRGMLRQHQFDKVELVSITTPEQSRDEHERMLTCAETVLKKLDLHYRVVTLSTGDMGFAAQKTYDIEVWLPGQAAYREISSVSVCGDFQARRMQARYKPKEGKGNRFVHTLNGSGIAVGRALIAVMENYQNPDGSIAVPDALKPYMRGVETIGA